MKINVTVWNEFRHERSDETVKKIYPAGMHSVIAGFLKTEEGMQARTMNA